MKASNHMISFEKKKKTVFSRKNSFKWNFYLPLMINLPIFNTNDEYQNNLYCFLNKLM